MIGPNVMLGPLIIEALAIALGTTLTRRHRPNIAGSAVFCNGRFRDRDALVASARALDAFAAMTTN
jgi:hypothetical protein